MSAVGHGATTAAAAAVIVAAQGGGWQQWLLQQLCGSSGEAEAPVVGCC